MILDPRTTVGTFGKEPALTTATFVASVISILSLLNKYFFPNLLTDDQEQVIYTVIAIVIPWITAYFIRRKVWSPASVQKALLRQKVNEALTKPNPRAVLPEDNS